MPSIVDSKCELVEGPPRSNPRWRRMFCLLLAVTMLGCQRSGDYPNRPITLVCPWAAGGGTDRVSRQVAMLLEQELGQPVSVINATGGKGVTGHSRGLRARPDGYTLLMMTFELNTMHWTGLTKLTYQDCIPLVSVNEDYAALLVRTDASWRTIGELEAEIRQRPKELTASGTALGGAWHLALAGWLADAGMAADDVVWVSSQGANPSLQQLVSGGVDMVCCSLPEARTLLEGGQVRALGVMAPQRAKGFEDIPTFIEQGRDWTLGGWRGLAVPLDTPPEIVERLTTALGKIVSAPAKPGSFAEFMDTQKFDRTWRPPQEFERFLAETDAKLGKLLTSDAMRSVSENRFSPMAYPLTLIGLIVMTVVGLIVVSTRRTSAEATTLTDEATMLTDEAAMRTDEAAMLTDEAATRTSGVGSLDDPNDSASGIDNLLWIVLSIALYALLAETVGFLLIAGVLVFAMLIKLGTRVIVSLLITATVVPAIYAVFAFGLRVPLPPGWMG